MDVPAGAALRWLGHDASNEFATLNALDRAEGYADYLKALDSWVCPGQNFAYADRDGTIALWHNGKYPLRWKGQGRFVLDGSDPANDWRGWVPYAHVPHVKDPERGFVSSANQAPVDASYPYYLGWDYAPYERGARINEILRSARDVTPEDMVRMQADVLDIRARAVLPRLLGDRLRQGRDRRREDVRRRARGLEFRGAIGPHRADGLPRILEGAQPPDLGRRDDRGHGAHAPAGERGHGHPDPRRAGLALVR